MISFAAEQLLRSDGYHSVLLMKISSREYLSVTDTGNSGFLRFIWEQALYQAARSSWQSMLQQLESMRREDSVMRSIVLDCKNLSIIRTENFYKTTQPK